MDLVLQTLLYLGNINNLDLILILKDLLNNLEVIAGSYIWFTNCAFNFTSV